MKAGNQMEILRKRSNQLEEEISEIKSTSSGPCANDACVAAMEELEQLRSVNIIIEFSLNSPRNISFHRMNKMVH